MLNIINAILNIICLLLAGAISGLFIIYYLLTRELKKTKRLYEKLDDECAELSEALAVKSYYEEYEKEKEGEK